MSERNSERKVAKTESPDPVTPKPRNCDIPPNVAEFTSWNSHEVNSFLKMQGLEDVASKFKDNVKGSNLPDINKNTLEEYGISDQETVDKVLMYIKMFKPSTPQVQSNQSPAPFYKVFNDSVHGHIEVHPLLVKIIDTPQFQRLRNIKQLGGCYYVFPGAAHNRFEHCIGTSHLAGKLASSLKKTHEQDQEIEITEKDVLCVSVAGLCHDLGHGPFSHMFGAKFIKAVKPEANWKHEKASVEMFDHLVEVNNLKTEFLKYNLDNTDLIFIKEMIHENRYRGRPKSQSYLYEIVANKQTGIDVDKWDYFARDCHNLGITNSFDHKRYIKMARVVKVEDGHQICVRDKEALNIYGMFNTRYCLHRQAYQHKMSNAIEMMLCEAFVKADPHLMIEGKDKQSLQIVKRKMSEAIHDMVAYTKLSDNVYYRILYSSEPNLQPAKEILKQIERRELYKYIDKTILKQLELRDKKDIPDICREITEKVPLDMAGDKPLRPEDIVVDLVTFDYGNEDKNPLDNMRFYTKEDPNQALVLRKDEVSGMLPNSFREQHLRVYCRSRDKDIIQKAKTGFEMWCQEQDCTTEFTPIKATTSGPSGPTTSGPGNVAKKLQF